MLKKASDGGHSLLVQIKTKANFKFPMKTHQRTKKPHTHKEQKNPTPTNKNQNYFEYCIVCFSGVGGSGRGGQYCTKKLAFKSKNTAH